MHFGTWLSVQRTRENARGIDHHELTCCPAKLTSYVRGQLDNAVLSLEHAGRGIPSLKLDEGAQRQGWEAHRDPFADDLVEALESIGALLVVIGCGSGELALRYGPDATECKTRVDELVPGAVNNDAPAPIPTKNPDTQRNRKPPASVIVTDAASGTPMPKK